MKSLIDINFSHYATCCMASLKVAIQNNALSVPNFEIYYADYYPTQLHKKFVEKACSTLGEHFLCETSQKYFSVPKAIQPKLLILL